MTSLALTEACTQTNWPDAVKAIGMMLGLAAIIWAIAWSVR